MATLSIEEMKAAVADAAGLRPEQIKDDSVTFCFPNGSGIGLPADCFTSADEVKTYFSKTGGSCGYPENAAQADVAEVIA